MSGKPEARSQKQEFHTGSLHQLWLEIAIPDFLISEGIPMMWNQSGPGFVCSDCLDGRRIRSPLIFAEIAVRSTFFDILPSYEF
jgi:hypothetical protein